MNLYNHLSVSKLFCFTLFFFLSIGCGQVSNEERKTGNSSESQESSFALSSVSVKLISEPESSSDEYKKQYDPGLIRVQVFNISNPTPTPRIIDIFPPFTTGTNLELIIGDVYDFYAEAYGDISGTDQVLYSGSLKNELINASTAEIRVLLSSQRISIPSILSSSFLNEITSKVTLSSEVNPNGNNTVVYFEWGENTIYTKKTMTNFLGILKTPVIFSESITGLSFQTTYYFRVVAENAGGIIYGQWQTFTTKSGTATLSWQPTTTDVRGNILTDLAGYKIYYRTSTETNLTVTDVINPPVEVTTGLVTYTFLSLPSGIYYFYVTAYNLSGNESMPSNEVSKIID